MKKILMKTSLVLLLVFGMAANAAAIQISGGISFAGSSVFDDPNDFTNATSVSFSNVRVSDTGGSGDYSTLLPLTPAAFSGFTFFPALSPNPLVSLWTVTVGSTVYSFDATGLTIAFRSENTITLEGTGIAHITGFDDTPGKWNISANRAGITSSFSSSTEVEPVPEPLTLILLGSGLIGLAGLRRKLS